MSKVRKTITLTGELDRWINSQIDLGLFTNYSEYIQHLLRRDKELAEELEALRAAVQAGIDSGISDRTFEDTWNDFDGRG